MNDDKKMIRFTGALLECLVTFPLFRDDIHLFIDEGVIKLVSSDRCEWTKSKTSLAEYFRWISYDAGAVTGGVWAPIEKTFGVKRGTLRKLAGNNANPLKPEQSKDFKKLKQMVLGYREDSDIVRERRIFEAIKKLVNETNGIDPAAVHSALAQIKNLTKNCGQKNRK